LLFDYLEETRALSEQEVEVRRLCHDWLSLAVKERAAYWKQRGKQKAVREGDSNTQFFHAHATQRMRCNMLKVVEVEGVPVTAHEGKISALTAHYRKILGEPGTSSFDFDLHELYAGRRQASDKLTEEFSATEALCAVRSMNRNSAPGPDGFGPSFYVAAWSAIHAEVMSFLRAFYDGSAQLERVNRS
jgi:hypothetical protein